MTANCKISSVQFTCKRATAVKNLNMATIYTYTNFFDLPTPNAAQFYNCYRTEFYISHT